MPMKTLILTDDETKRLLTMEEVMAAVELAFAEKGLKRVQTPQGTYLFHEKYNGDLRASQAYLEVLDISIVRVASVYPENRTKNHLPTGITTLLVIDPENGTPIAIMGGTWITDLRTGAAGGVAAKHLAIKAPKIVCLVGAGAQAKTQLMALLSYYERLEEVRVWSRTRETRQSFLAEMMKRYAKKISRLVPVDRVEDAVRGAHIIVTATPSRAPIVMNEWISSGAHINCVGADAPGKQELDPAILKRAKIVVDDWEQASQNGEINVPISKGILKPEDIWCELGEVVAKQKQGRTSDDEITVFVSSGLAMQDAVTANIAYKKAMTRGRGKIIEIIAEGR